MQVKYLGHIVSQHGVAVDPEKVAAVQKMGPPRNAKELQRFLGFVGFNRRFIPKFSALAHPLYDLLKSPEFEWREEHQDAFRALVRMVTEAPVLGYADFSKPFVLQVDASLSGLGAILLQEQDGGRRVIAYGSRSLKPSERKYPVHKLEFLALKWAVTEKFHDYLYASSFEVITDNSPMTYVLKKAKLDATSQRWVAALACYDFNITYQPGRDNVAADFLSRLPETVTEDAEVVKAILQSAGNPVPCATMTVPPDLLEMPSLPPIDVLEAQRADPVLKSDVDGGRQQPGATQAVARSTFRASEVSSAER
jgi:hypothetical protein